MANTRNGWGLIAGTVIGILGGLSGRDGLLLGPIVPISAVEVFQHTH